MKRIALALMLGLVGAAAVAAPPSATDVARVHAAAQPFDTHIDIPADLGLAPPTAGHDQFSLAQARAGGLAAAGLAVFAVQTPDTAEGRAAALAEAEGHDAAIERLVAAPGAKLARSAADVRRIAAAGDLAVVKTIVNGGSFAVTPEQISAWEKRGVRIFGLVHAGHNALADSSRPALPRGEPLERWGGLSPAGRAAIAQLNDLGIAVDVSQLSAKAFADAISLTRVPVLATHSGLRHFVDVGRNLSDTELDALKANGGVIGIVAFSAYLKNDSPATQAKLKALRDEYGVKPDGSTALPPEQLAAFTKASYAARAEEPKASVAQLVDQIDYAVRRIGIDHVAVASDFNHGGGITGWADTSQARAVTAELLARGYSPADIAKLWSGNVLRVLAAAEAGKRP